ncbi:MAG: response regulator transcription factor [Lysobacter sp.]|nr:response regulator transcription factor [Lysobacter sp.]
MTIRIYIVDDHALVRAGMRMILSAELDIDVVGEADSGEAALPQIRNLKPDVVLCDLHLPGASGLDLTERLMKLETPPKVIVVSVLDDGPLPRRVLEAGASGYVGKGGDPRELLSAVRSVALGKRYLANTVAQNIALAGLGVQSALETLSPRETEVALLLAQGLKNEEIARQLCLSGKTVSTHKQRLFEKAGVRDTVTLARLLRQHGFLDPAESTP